jgi:putative oxidoreductase
MKKLIAILGKVLFAIPLLIFGIIHLINAKEIAPHAPSFLPYHIFWIVLTGLGLMAAAVSLLINKYVRLSMFLLALFLLSTILLIYVPGLRNPQFAQMASTNLLKDICLLGAALYFAGTSTDS